MNLNTTEEGYVEELVRRTGLPRITAVQYKRILRAYMDCYEEFWQWYGKRGGIFAESWIHVFGTIENDQSANVGIYDIPEQFADLRAAVIAARNTADSYGGLIQLPVSVTAHEQAAILGDDDVQF